MPTSYTSNLRLSNPGLGDTGWGSTVSNGMIDLVDPAIAGTTTLSADTDVILTTANGMTDQARQMILNCTGSRAAQRTITAPASSKVYVVINGTTGGFGVKIVGVGPTTGVVVPAGRMAVVAWNGSDFVTLGAVVDLTASGNVTVAGTLGVGTTSPTAKLHVAGQTRIQDSANASNYVLIGSGTNAPRGGNSVMAQTGSMVMGTEAASSLFFVTNAATAMTLDASGTLGVGTTSPTGAKVVIEGPASAPSVFNALALRNSLDGSVALIFDNSASATLASIEALITSTGAGTDDGVLAFGTALNGVNAERMRLDASGNLGLGVNPSTSLGTSIKLFVNGASGGGIESFYNNLGGFALVPPPTGAGLIFYTFTGGVGAESYSERMRLDASGNLGLGVTPSAWGGARRAIQIAGASLAGVTGANTFNELSANRYINTSGQDIYIGTGEATVFQQTGGGYRWYTAPSGTAGNAISFTQAMTLNNAGDLGVGTTNPVAKFAVRGFDTTNYNTASFGNGVDVQSLDVMTGRELTNNTVGGVVNSLVMTLRSSGLSAGVLAFATGNTERARFTAVGDFIHQVNGTAPTLSTNSTMSFELTSNTSLKIVVRGTDGVTRSVSLTLS
jgi:hypothetical protein